MLIWLAFKLWMRDIQRKAVRGEQVFDEKITTAYAAVQYDIDHGFGRHTHLWDGVK